MNTSAAGRTPPAGTKAHSFAEAEATHRALTMRTFQLEMTIGHRLAYLRTFASPRVAALLDHTGQMRADPRRRATDTGVLMYMLIHHGLDSDIGLAIVERLNDLHEPYRIRNEDYLWVLATFTVLGIQVIDRHGWRKLLDHERQAILIWYRELGTRMGITNIPDTYTAFEAWFSDYERANLRRTAAGDRLIAINRDIILSGIPHRLRRRALTAASVIIPEPARTALALPTPGPLTTAAVKLTFRIRAIVRRQRRTDPPPRFVPGAPNKAYPCGYRLNISDHHGTSEANPSY